MNYSDLYNEWLNDPLKYWENKAEDIDWYKKWDLVLDESKKPFYRWFKGGQLNTCYNCLDRHVQNGKGDNIAIIYDSPISGKKDTLTYKELLKKVAKTAGALKYLDVHKGDRVLIYMPMIPETVISMLACARIGAIHSVVFGGFATNELVTRIDDASPKLIIAASCGLEPNRIINYKLIVDEAISKSSNKPSNCIIYQREQQKVNMVKGRDYDWNIILDKAEETECEPVLATDPLYILYTSGTTGAPKGIIRDNGGHAVALKNSMNMTYGMTSDEVFWAASDVGWVVGHSYIVYAPLLHGCTTVIYEGKPIGTPDAGQFWRVIDEHKVSVMFTAPTALRAIKKEDPQGKFIKSYNLKSFRYQFLAGERADPETIKWAQKHLNIPVIDHWWQTETGWSIAGNFIEPGLFPIKPGSTGKSAPGYNVKVLDNNKKEVERGKLGTLVIKLPLPPGSSPTIWGNDDRFYEAYLKDFPGYYTTSDAGFIDEEDYISVMSRTDDIINCAGHRLSTGGIEEILSKQPEVAECAVVGIKDSIKGQVPLGFIVLNSETTKPHKKIIDETIALIRESIGAVASYKNSIIVKRLPKTRSGKILRSTIAKIVNNEKYTIPATIEDLEALEDVKKALISTN